MLKANIINESFDNMLRNIINESKLNEDNELRDGVEEELRNILMDTVSKLVEDRIIDLKRYEIELQDAIEKVFPDLSWWEVTSTNIFMDLFEKRDPWAVVDDIMNTLTITDEEGEDQEYTPSLTSDDMNAGQWYESLEEETEDKVDIATKTNDQSVLAKLADDPDKNVREVVAMRVQDTDILQKLSGDSSWLVRKEVARRGIPEILSKLVNDENPSVRETVALKAKDPKILAKLANDKNPNVVMAIFNNDSATNEIIDSINNRLFSHESNESLKESKKLDEKIPKDLSKSMRRDFANQKYYRTDSSRFNRDSTVGVNGVVDYENSTYQEVDADTIKQMKKNGEDLSKVYVVKDGEHIKLDADGHPTWQSADVRGIRSNQSLNKTLQDADKIYISNEKFVKDTQPEKFAQRHQDQEERNNNMNLGAYRSDRSDEDRYRKYMYRNDHKSKKAIERAKQDYEDGDISRKEMERIIANNKPEIDTYSGRNYQEIRNRKSDAINYAANKSASAKVSEYKELKRSIPDAQRVLTRAKNDLDSFINGGDTNSWTDYGYNKRNANRYKEKIADLERQLEFAREQLKSYEDKLTNDAYGAEVSKLEDSIAKANDDLESKTARLKALLRKNEALRRSNGNKKLNEGYTVEYSNGQTFNPMDKKQLYRVIRELPSAKSVRGSVVYPVRINIDGKEAVVYNTKQAKAHLEKSFNSLTEDKDLSKVESSMTNVLEKNISKINSCSTVKEIVDTVKDILEKNGIDTKASQRLIKNIEKQKSIMGAFSTVYNSCLAGEDQSTIKLKKTYK